MCWSSLVDVIFQGVPAISHYKPGKHLTIVTIITIIKIPSEMEVAPRYNC